MAIRRLSDEERKENIRLYNLRYSQSAKGRQKQKEAIYRYQQTEKYKDYKRRYYQNKKYGLLLEDDQV